MNPEIIIIGAGGHGRVIADIVKSAGDTVLGFLDDGVAGSNICGRILGAVSDCIKFKDKLFIIAIGNNEVRKNISLKYPDLNYYTAVHPAAAVSDSARIGSGTCVMPGAVIAAGAKVGAHCIVNTNAVIEHDCVLEDYVHVSPSATLCGTVRVGEGTHIGACAVAVNNIRIAPHSVIGAGAAVIRNADSPGTYVGVPARKIK